MLVYNFVSHGCVLICRYTNQKLVMTIAVTSCIEDLNDMKLRKKGEHLSSILYDGDKIYQF